MMQLVEGTISPLSSAAVNWRSVGLLPICIEDVEKPFTTKISFHVTV
jgi:hypothetical protein